MSKNESSMARRLFLAQLGAGATVVGAGVVGATVAASPAAMAQAPADTPWRPARHAQDDWFDKIPGEHRLFFDTTTPEGMGTALLFATNYFTANQTAYNLKDSDLAVVIVTRHKSTSFGFNDAMWAKYGKTFSEQANFTDPKTKEAPTVNVYAVPAAGTAPAGQINGLIKKGAQFAVCQMATRAIAGRIARAKGGEADPIYNELTANLIGNARMVPAGIVAVNRAQERGYSLVTAV